MSEILNGAYVARLNLSDPHHLGVSSKIRAQVNALRNLPGSVALYNPERSTICRDGKVVRRWPEQSFWIKWNHYFFFNFFIARHLKELDFVYMRYQGCSPFVLIMLWRLRHHNPKALIIIEIPTYPYGGEKITLRETIFQFIDQLSRVYIYRYVDLIVTFSKEKRIFGVPTIQINNGVDVDALKVLGRPKQTEPFRLLGLANLAFWHGYDRVIAGMAKYKAQGGTRRVVFDVVGVGAELTRLQRAADQAGLSHEVRFHGALHGESLSRVVEGAHVGVACIGIHRVDKDTSDLKSREFCARGLPFVNAYQDRDFNCDFPYLHKVPGDDSELDIFMVQNFYDELAQSHPNYPAEMREFALNHLTWNDKLAPVCTAIRTNKSLHR